MLAQHVVIQEGGGDRHHQKEHSHMGDGAVVMDFHRQGVILNY